MKRLFRWKQISPPLKLETLIATFWVPETTKRPRCITVSEEGSLRSLLSYMRPYLVVQRDSRFVSRNCHATHIAKPNGLVRTAFKYFSVINEVYSYKATQTRNSNVVYYFRDPTNVGWFLRFLSPSLPQSVLHVPVKSKLQHPRAIPPGI